MIVNFRHQRPVGQGFFHTGEVINSEHGRLIYVYDCGSMQKYRAVREAEIKHYLLERGARTRLDLLFLSHIHYDHISGIEALLDTKSGLKVDTIVLPLLDMETRLISYARAVSAEFGVAKDAFYQDLIVNPGDALARFNPRRIILVQPGDRPGAPGSGALDGPRDDPPDSRDLRAEVWKLVGSGRVQLSPASLKKSDGGDPAQVTALIDDTFAFAPVPGQDVRWILAPYVDPIVVEKRETFLQALADASSISKPELEKELKRTDYVRDLLQNRLDDLRDAYAAIEPDFNVTSLCLYSGPVPLQPVPDQDHEIQFGGWNAVSHNQRIAWLGTGDASLRPDERSEALRKHFGALLDEVVTMTLPHHGSDHNLNPKLIETIGAYFFVAAADQFAKWRHPGTKVIQAVASIGRFVSVVTSAQSSRVVELARTS